LIKPKICSNCGAKLKENFMFCPECGKKWDSSEKHLTPKPKKTEKMGIEAKVEKTIPSKKAKSKAASPKVSFSFLKNFKRPGKKVLMIISVICIVLVAAAAVIVFYPFNGTGGTSFNGGTFTVTVENNYNDAVEYYFIVENVHEIILHVSIDGFSWGTPGIVPGVTESVTFEIFDDNGTISVNCTESQ